ncbi:MAG TPA: bifunctional transaldolase/phosoglucose isomerase [Candidatus Binataceae bacterium]|nr:bifunctional transaldolase/phosoglucose isomerase [Candidatus Binataceae bacterium]
MSSSGNPLRRLEDFGQSVWLDYIRRHLLSSPEFRKMIDEDGLKGMTSNPTIFEKAIGGSTDYDKQFEGLVRDGKSVDELYEALTTEDIKTAADALRPLYDRTHGGDGFVSYEVSPQLANDTDGTIQAAHRCFELINRPNLMIKVPATPAGLPAIERLISEGHNVNITLMFSMKHYDAVAEGYIRGLEKRAAAGQPLDNVASVASVFVSRVETLVDRKLEEKLKAKPDEAAAALRGSAAVANARLIYHRFKEIFGSERFKRLAARGAHVQRPLWASTGTKNPAYSDIKYVQELIGPDTVNTMPPATMDAYRDHGQPGATIERGLGDAQETVKRLAALGIDLDQVGDELQQEGVDSFDKSFADLLATIKGRREAIVAGSADRQTISAGAYEPQVAAARQQLDKEEFAQRLWRKDATLWKKDPQHQAIIRNALGWLTVPELMEEQVAVLRDFAGQVVKEHFGDVVLLGMGGSSLCPEVFGRTFFSAQGYPHLHVLDSTVPAQIRAVEKRIDVAHTLFLVSSKSGGTVETLSHCAYFYDQVKARNGILAGRSFVAITDPGTSLEKLAKEHDFRHTFLNPHDIGGRYSALSYFGLVPAALIGMDVGALLDRAVRMQHSSAGYIRTEANPAVSLGAALGALQKAGRDKVTFVVSPPIAAFGLWVEQLIAESTGKESTGLIPICDEPVGTPDNYASDRIFAYLRLENGADPAQDSAVEALRNSGAPVVQIAVADRIDLGDEFMRWEIATATAGSIMGIDAFDQPNVQESKDNTGRLLKEFESSGALPAESPTAGHGVLSLYCPPSTRDKIAGAADFDELLKGFFKLANSGDYFAIMAYMAPATAVDREITRMRTAVRNHLKIATTFGYGPRFLHSTGQLHKGGPNKGLFLQITQDHDENPAIPGARYGFATLNQAQYLGDYESLRNHGRRVLRVHLHGDPETALAGLRHAVVAALG